MEQSVTTTATRSRLRVKVLVIDPDIPFLNTVSRLLVEAGHEPRRANSVAHGLAKCDGWEPDIVVVDRIICLSERGAVDRLMTIASSGPSSFVVTDMAEEPVRPIALLTEIHRRLGERGLLAKATATTGRPPGGEPPGQQLG